MKKRILSVLLGVIMLVGIFPISAFAEPTKITKIEFTDFTANINTNMSGPDASKAISFNYSSTCNCVKSANSNPAIYQNGSYMLTSTKLEEGAIIARFTAYAAPYGNDVQNPTYDFDSSNLDKIEVYVNGVKQTDATVLGYNSSWRSVMVDIPVTVTYVPPVKKTVSIIGGGTGSSGSGSYPKGEVVEINAGTKKGYTFAGWTTSSKIKLTYEKSEKSSFTMPENDVTLTANWVKTQKISSLDFIFSGFEQGKMFSELSITPTAKTAEKLDNYKNSYFKGSYAISTSPEALKLNVDSIVENTATTFKDNTDYYLILVLEIKVEYSESAKQLKKENVKLGGLSASKVQYSEQDEKSGLIAVFKLEKAPCKNNAHTLKTGVNKKSATYFKTGYSGDSVCKVCNNVVKKGKVIAKKKLSAPKVKVTAGKRYIKVNYKKVSGATGFQVNYKIGKKSVVKTYSTKKSLTKTVKKLKKGSYKVKVRAFVKSGKSKAYSSWTKTKTYKVK